MGAGLVVLGRGRDVVGAGAAVTVGDVVLRGTVTGGGGPVDGGGGGTGGTGTV
jgi:hypothetical protein